MLQETKVVQFELISSSADQLLAKQNIFTPITSIIIDPLSLPTFLLQFPSLQTQLPSPPPSLSLFLISSIPHFICSSNNPTFLKSLLTISKHVICYHISPDLQNIIEKKWWDHKSLSHMYHLSQKIPTLYFFNSRVKANKELQEGKLRYCLDEEIQNIFEGIWVGERNAREILNLNQICQLLDMFVNNQGGFKQSQYFTDRLNYIELFRLEKNRLLKEEIGDMISNAAGRSNEIHEKIQQLDIKSKRLFQRKIRKLHVFQGIVDKQTQKQEFLKTRLKSSSIQQSSSASKSQKEETKQKDKNIIHKSRWYTNRIQYVQRLVIIIMVIAMIQIIFGHNLLTLTISLIMAIFYLKFID